MGHVTDMVCLYDEFHESSEVYPVSAGDEKATVDLLSPHETLRSG